VLEFLRKRRSIRKYKEKAIEKEKVEQLIKAVLLSPSSRSLRPWEFIFVDDREILIKLSKSKEHGAAFLKNAALGVVIIADPEKCDVWVEDSSIASIILQLMAESLNLGSCWIQIRKRWHGSFTTAEDYVKGLLDIPEKYRVQSIIAIGYPNENKAPYEYAELQYGKIYQNSFGYPYNK